MLFEIFIGPDITDLSKIRTNLISFLKFRNFLDKHKVFVYTKFDKGQLSIPNKYLKLDIDFVKIDDNITSIKKLWTEKRNLYDSHMWIIHYNIKDQIIEFDFIKMIFKKLKNTFVKKSHTEIFDNLFCINKHLMEKFIQADCGYIDVPFILSNSQDYYFLKYMNIITKTKDNRNIYI